jgi:hypothetical protein
MVVAIDESVPNPNNAKDEVQKTSWKNALDYTQLKADGSITAWGHSVYGTVSVTRCSI